MKINVARELAAIDKGLAGLEGKIDAAEETCCEVIARHILDARITVVLPRLDGNKGRYEFATTGGAGK